MRSVTDYGANGDGTGDDRDAIQAAVDDAHADGGGRVYLPPGDYRVEGPITHRSRVHLVGGGMGATTVRAEGQGFAAVEGFGDPDDPLTDLAVEDLSVDASGVPGDDSYDPGEKCVFYQHVRRCRVVGVHAYGSAATGIGTDMMVDSLVHGCVAEDCGRNFEAARDGLNIGSNGIGIGTGLAADAEPVVVADCHARDNGNNGVMFENQATGDREAGAEHHAGHFFAHGCTATGNRVGFRTSADRRVRFANCSAHANEEDGVVIDEKGEMRPVEMHPPFPAREHRIDGCHVTDNGECGVHVLGADAALDVSNCQIAGNGEAGVRVATGDPVADVSVTDCRVFDNGGPGVAFADGGANLRIADCDLYDNADGDAVGVRLGGDAARVTVSGCHVRGAADARATGVAFAADHEDAALVGNQFHGCDPLDADPFPATVRNNVGLRTESAGTAEATGDGETAEFAVRHGLGAAPAVRNVWAESPAAIGFHVAGADDEAVRVAYPDPPAEGADLRWGFDVRR